MACAMVSGVGTTTASRLGLYGVGVKAPLSRRIGASRSSKPASASWAAISAPIPHGPNASSTISNRPVLATDWRIVSTSSGATVRGSISSIEMPSAGKLPADCKRVVHHQGQGNDGDVAAGVDDGGAGRTRSR